MSISREMLIERLRAKGHEPTEHNITCEEFAFEFEKMGAPELVEDICYEGSAPWLNAMVHDGKEPYAASEGKTRQDPQGHVN